MGETLIDLSNVLGTQLLAAIRQQDVNEAKRKLRKSDIDVTVTDTTGMGCLHYAASNGLADITRQLIMEKNMDVNTRDGVDQTPLHKATSTGNIDIMVMLAALGANLAAMDNMKNMPLTLAVKNNNLEAVQTLVLLGSPAITTDTAWRKAKMKSHGKRIEEESLEAIMADQQKTCDALKHGEIIHGLQHTYESELPTIDDSLQPSEDESMRQIDFPDLQISVKHIPMKRPFVLYIRRTRPDVAHGLPKLSDNARLFGDIIAYKAWFLPKTSVKMAITVDGILRMNECLDIKSSDEQSFDGKMGVPEIDRQANVTKVEIVLTTKDLSSSQLKSFALIATAQKESFNITDRPAVLKPNMEPNSNIYIPERAFESPGVLNIEFTDSSDANDDQDNDDEPLLMTNILDIEMEDGQQPIAPIDIELPVAPNTNSDDVVILGLSDRTSEKTLQWTLIERALGNSCKSTNFQVSHFSTYVGASRKMVRQSFDEVTLAATRSLKKQRKVVFLAMAKSPDTRTESYSIVVECCTKRKVQQRIKHWTSNDYQANALKGTLQETLSENEKLRVRLDGMFDPEVEPMELTFLPNSASYKVFDQIFPIIQQKDENTQDKSDVKDEPIFGKVIIENMQPMQEPEVVSEDAGCYSGLETFIANIKSKCRSSKVDDQLISQLKESKYCRLGAIDISLTMPDESVVSDD